MVASKTRPNTIYPLSNILNAILLFEPKVIFVVNDPIFLVSDHLPFPAKRKPDIILVSLETFNN